MNLKKFSAVLVLSVASLAFADDAAPVVADSTAPANCTQPPLPNPSSAISGEATRIVKPKASDFNTQFQAYQTCMKAYVAAQSELSKQHIAAANAAVKQLNDFGQKVNDALGN
jgi:predicted lipoprotein